MKLAVVGSRTFTDRNMLYEYLDKAHKTNPIKNIISGGARGADTLARD